MATRRYSISPGQTEFQVLEAVGAATVSGTVEVTVDLANTIIKDANTTLGTRSITREEVLIALEQIRNHVISKNWTPA